MIKFNEEEHSYTDSQNKRWVSVTGLIKAYEPKKDWDKIAKNFAKKNNMAVEDVKALWDKNREDGCDRGTRYHKEREEDLLNCETITIDNKELTITRPEFDSEGIKLSPDQKLLEGVYPELLVYLNSAEICGQADIVEVVNGKVNIKDYKTNKEIKRNGFYNWEGKEEKLVFPLGNISNSNFWIYTLQLNTYMYIILKNNPNLKIGKMTLLHIIFDETENVEKVVPYDVPDRQSDVKRMIEHFKSTKK